MSDASMIIMPEEIPALARQWKELYGADQSRRAAPHRVRLRDRLRQSYFRRLAKGYVPGLRATTDGRIDGAKVRRVLLVRYDALGDYICSTGLITWLRAAVPHAEIEMISSPRNDAVARRDPNLVETYPVDYQFTTARPSSLEPLRRAAQRDYDVVLGLAMTRMSKLAALVSYVAPRAEKVVLLHHERAHIYGEFFDHQVERIGWTDHWQNSFTRQGAETIAPVAPTPSLPVPNYLVIDEEGWRAARDFMEREELGFRGYGPGTVLGRGWEGPAPAPFEGRRYAILNISAFGVERQMPASLATGIARLMLERHPDRTLYVTGVPAEQEQVRAIVSAVGDGRCRSLGLALNAFLCVVGGASLVISPDTATVHIAAAHRVPVVGLYGEKVKVAEWHPIGTDFAIVLGREEPTIEGIPPEQVLDAVERLEGRIAAR